ncbi:cell envelope integrity protein CreD [Roseomonas stagni]|uniref:Cell envelope integrity protein CreD n=1 Tax=Falsiroseomonas algicola TaxID=2716930 RepID=A0A6M1LER4_9PROT|nr:cell envelope integrity protein CreD [Falsiroseomonas algicola]NGM18474.1 cell envelope integrity protein CreD [Falsiroseomonas algicola]
MEPEPKRGLLEGPTAKLVAVGLVLMAMLIPHLMIGGVIEEREERHRAVQREIGAGWGGPQVLMGPVLAVPWSADARRGYFFIQPERLDATVELAPQLRRRGLYEVPVFTAMARLEGSFNVTDAMMPQDIAAVPHWQDARVIAGGQAFRLAGQAPSLRLGDAMLPAEEGLPRWDGCMPSRGVMWQPRLAAAPDGPVSFAVTLPLRGSERFGLMPGPVRTNLAMSAAWPTPSFIGDDLPEQSSVEEAGFSANWSLVGGWGAARNTLCGRQSPAAGVELLEAVPTYRMVNRASKYAMLFLALSFVTYTLFELLAGLRIHIVQYAMLGCSVVMFPLLLLAIGEPLGFAAAYAAATLLVMAQASLFTAAVTGRRILAAAFAGVLAALFGFLYVVLSLEAYALLVGTLALFTVLSVVMALTRRVRWG